MRIRPYRTVDNVIDGVVMTFVDISERRKADGQKSLLLAELDHRVKNILAIVSSVITRTLKTSSTPARSPRRWRGVSRDLSGAQHL